MVSRMFHVKHYDQKLYPISINERKKSYNSKKENVSRETFLIVFSKEWCYTVLENDEI